MTSRLAVVFKVMLSDQTCWSRPLARQKEHSGRAPCMGSVRVHEEDTLWRARRGPAQLKPQRDQDRVVAISFSPCRVCLVSKVACWSG